jgi:hypothetical protein
MSGLDRAERSARRLGALVAIAAATTALPGMVRVSHDQVDSWSGGARASTASAPTGSGGGAAARS